MLAGTNGCGKSSIGGALLRRAGTEHFNPDEVAKQILALNPELSQFDANGQAWLEGKRLLERTIEERGRFALETTLGGNTIVNLLRRALLAGLEVRMWYAGLSSPELHITRVRARVAAGGHDIPESDIRRRYDTGRLNLIDLLPRLTELRLYDNSAEADPVPRPILILLMEKGRITGGCSVHETPDWAKPIVAAAIKCQPDRR